MANAVILAFWFEDGYFSIRFGFRELLGKPEVLNHQRWMIPVLHWSWPLCCDVCHVPRSMHFSTHKGCFASSEYELLGSLSKILFKKDPWWHRCLIKVTVETTIQTQLLKRSICGESWSSGGVGEYTSHFLSLHFVQNSESNSNLWLKSHSQRKKCVVKFQSQV